MTLGPVVIAAAGTGGHIYPGLALAEAIRRREPERRIVFTGTPRGLENTLIPQAGYPLDLYAMVPLAGKNKYRAPFALVRSSFQARRILRREGAAVAVSMGGYGGIPLVLGGRLAKVPVAVHESGAVAGRANVLAARFTPKGSRWPTRPPDRSCKDGCTRTGRRRCSTRSNCSMETPSTQPRNSSFRSCHIHRPK